MHINASSVSFCSFHAGFWKDDGISEELFSPYIAQLMCIHRKPWLQWTNGTAPIASTWNILHFGTWQKPFLQDTFHILLSYTHCYNILNQYHLIISKLCFQLKKFFKIVFCFSLIFKELMDIEDNHRRKMWEASVPCPSFPSASLALKTKKC